MPLVPSKPFPGFLQSLGLLLLAMVLGLQALLVCLVFGWARSPEGGFDFNGWVLVGVNTVAFGGASVLGWLRSRRPFLSVFPFRSFPRRLVAPILVMAPAALIVLNLVTAGLFRLAPDGGSESWVDEFMRDMLNMLLQNRTAAFAAVVLMAPFTEELFFRGLLLQGFARRYGPGPAIVGTTVLFAVAHFNPVQLPATLVLGAYLAWLTLQTGSLWPAVMAHAANNLAALIATWSMGPEAAEGLGAGPWLLNLVGLAAAAGAGLWLLSAAARRPQVPPNSGV